MLFTPIILYYIIDQINPSINKSLNNNKIINSSINSIYISPTIPLEVDKIIKSLKNKKSTGYDDISVKVIKLVVTLYLLT